MKKKKKKKEGREKRRIMEKGEKEKKNKLEKRKEEKREEEWGRRIRRREKKKKKKKEKEKKETKKKNMFSSSFSIFHPSLVYCFNNSPSLRFREENWTSQASIGFYSSSSLPEQLLVDSQLYPALLRSFIPFGVHWVHSGRLWTGS